jgi:hypothetical protein
VKVVRLWSPWPRTSNMRRPAEPVAPG